METIVIEKGSYGDFPHWEIEVRSNVGNYDVVPCFHAILITETHPEWSENALTNPDKTQFLIPRLAVAYNEGGHRSTGICIDCILEAIAKL